MFEPWCIYISSNQAKNETRVSWDRVYIVLMDFSSKIAWMSLSETCSQFRIYHIIQISVRNLGAISAVFPSHGWLMIHLSSVACKYILRCYKLFCKYNLCWKPSVTSRVYHDQISEKSRCNLRSVFRSRGWLMSVASKEFYEQRVSNYVP